MKHLEKRQKASHGKHQGKRWTIIPKRAIQSLENVRKQPTSQPEDQVSKRIAIPGGPRLKHVEKKTTPKEQWTGPRKPIQQGGTRTKKTKHQDPIQWTAYKINNTVHPACAHTHHKKSPQDMDTKGTPVKPQNK